MRNMYVTMGETNATETEAWVSQAKMVLGATEEKTATGTRPTPTPFLADGSFIKPSSARPATVCRDCKAVSDTKPPYVTTFYSFHEICV